METRGPEERMDLNPECERKLKGNGQEERMEKRDNHEFIDVPSSWLDRYECNYGNQQVYESWVATLWWGVGRN